MLGIKVPFPLCENTFDFEIIYDNKEAKVELIDQIDPFEIYDKYVVNKHGIIFREFILNN